MLSVTSWCWPGPKVSPNSPRYTNCATCDSRTISCAPRLIALSSSGKRQHSVSRESSVHSMISSNSPLMKSISPIRRSLWCPPSGGPYQRPSRLQPSRERAQARGDEAGIRGVPSPQGVALQTRERLFDFAPGARQFDRQRRIDRLCRALLGRPQLQDQRCRLLHVEHRQWRAAVAAGGAAGQIDRPAAVRAVHNLNVTSQLRDPFWRERPDEILLAEEVEE